MSKLIPTYIEQALRIEVLERAVIASDGDVERLERELAEARNDALEEAAQVCDSELSCEGIVQKCAAAIRAMKNECGK